MESKSVKIRNKRIAKEVKLLKNLPPEILFGKLEKSYGTIIRIEIQSSLIKSQFLSSDVEKLYFEILLTEKFPYQAPQVYCKTKIGFPTINDYRDVLEAVIQKEWNPSMTIYETVQMIPEFVSDLLLEMTKDEDTIHDWVQSKNYKVHTGQSYHVTDWGVNFFKVREETETLDGFQYHERYIAVYENSFLLFEPDKKEKDMARLVAYATLCTLEKISRNLDMPEFVTFIWRKLENQKEQWVLKVEIQNYVECINLIVKYLKMLDVTVQKKYEKKRKILASEVNDKAIKKTDVSELLKQVTDAEHAMEKQITHKTVKTLMDSYQKAIEYYSALENSCYEEFLHKMTNLFKREEVQKALAQSEAEEEKTEEEPPSSSGEAQPESGESLVTSANPSEEGEQDEPSSDKITDGESGEK